MRRNGTIPNWFLWIVEHFPAALLICLLLLGAVFGAAFYFDHRLSDIEDQLSYTPPKAYQAPDLEAYDPGDVTPASLTRMHLVYVPVYSHIYYGGGSPYPLESTLSIRNVDASRAIYVESVEYYDTTGTLATTPLAKLIKLAPLQTIEFLIESRDSRGGSGANFLVRWGSMTDVDRPLIETVMVGTSGTHGISFGRTGIEISLERPAEP